jgi:hypothetical protein
MLQIILVGVVGSVPHREAHMGDARLQKVVDRECSILHPSDLIHPMTLMEGHEYLCNEPAVREPARSFKTSLTADLPATWK